MKSADQIIQHFLSAAKLFSEHKEFSTLPGIYAVLYFGKSNTLGAITGLKSGLIIYIGKTLSSQQSRDADTHFKSGKSGSSTLRRSIGALLREEMNFNPIPRGSGKTTKDTTNYRFDDSSEKALSEWMHTNLGLAFFEYEKSPEAIRNLEKALINHLSPALNIDSNQANPFLRVIKSERAKCKKLAEQKLEKSVIAIKVIRKNDVLPKQTKKSGGVHLYEKVWKPIQPQIKEAILSEKEIRIPLSKSMFDAVGNRKSDSFNIQYENGKQMNNLDGSAVARDLDKLILGNSNIMRFLEGKTMKITMGKDYVLKIQFN